MKKLIWIGVGIGSSIGSAIPMLWGGSLFSFTSMFLSAIGAFAGIYVAYQIGQRW